MYTYMYIYVYIYVHICIHMFTYMYTCMYTCVTKHGVSLDEALRESMITELIPPVRVCT